MLPTSELYKQAVISSTRSSDASIYFGIYDVTAKSDSVPVASNSQPFTSISGIKDTIRTPLFKMATFEDDSFSLGGGSYLTPDDVGTADLLGWWSLVQSRADKTFLTNPTITITFSAVHSSLGVGLLFDPLNGGMAEDFTVAWYNGTSLLDSVNITGNSSAECGVIRLVSNYNKLVITFTKTNKPYRYIKLMEVNFGLETSFSNNELISAKIVEELDPISSVISMNTLTFTVLNADQKFNMINPSGIYAFLQRKQQIIARSKLLLSDGTYETVELGTFYLSDWKNSTGMTATLRATDAIGLLDKTMYYKSPFWVNASITSVVTQILADAGTFPFIVEASALSEVVNGYLPIMSHREALKRVLVACRCALRMGRDGIIRILKNDYTTLTKSIGYDCIVGTPRLEQKPLVTSAIVKEYSYLLAASATTIHQSTFTLNGTSLMVIPYDKAPASEASISVTGSGTVSGTPVFSATSVSVTIIGTGTVTVTVKGKVYAISTRVITALSGAIPAGEVPQAATLADNSLICGDGKGLLVANNLLSYYARRIKQSFGYWSDPALQAGDYIGVENMFGGSSNGMIERQEITFSPNLQATVEVTG